MGTDTRQQLRVDWQAVRAQALRGAAADMPPVWADAADWLRRRADAIEAGAVLVAGDGQP